MGFFGVKRLIPPKTPSLVLENFLRNVIIFERSKISISVFPTGFHFKILRVPEHGSCRSPVLNTIEVEPEVLEEM